MGVVIVIWCEVSRRVRGLHSRDVRSMEGGAVRRMVVLVGGRKGGRERETERESERE